MRYLGIDYGEKRIGLALSDEGGRLAFPHGVASRFEEVVEAIRREGVGVVVIGLPFTLSGEALAEAEAVRSFAARLGKAVQLPIAFEDERFTSKIAERHTPKEKADASAAALILQSYLDTQRTA